MESDRSVSGDTRKPANQRARWMQVVNPAPACECSSAPELPALSLVVDFFFKYNKPCLGLVWFGLLPFPRVCVLPLNPVILVFGEKASNQTGGTGLNRGRRRRRRHVCLDLQPPTGDVNMRPSERSRSAGRSGFLWS